MSWRDRRSTVPQPPRTGGLPIERWREPSGPRRRPPRVAPRARHGRPRRDRRFGACAGGRPRLRAQRLRRRGRRIRACGDTLGTAPPAALPGRGRDVARRPGRAGDLVPRRSAARRRRPTARGRDRAPARPDHGEARAGHRGARDPGRGRRARAATTIRRPRRSCSPRRRIQSFYAGDAREMLRDGRAGRRARARARRTGAHPRGPRPGHGSDPGRRGGARRRRDPRRRRASGGVGRAARRPVPRRLGGRGTALASRGRSGARPLRPRTGDRPQPNGPRRAPRTPRPCRSRLGDHERLDQRTRGVQRGDHARARDRAGRRARLRARRTGRARGPPGTGGRVPHARGGRQGGVHPGGRWPCRSSGR